MPPRIERASTWFERRGLSHPLRIDPFALQWATEPPGHADRLAAFVFIIHELSPGMMSSLISPVPSDVRPAILDPCPRGLAS